MSDKPEGTKAPKDPKGMPPLRTGDQLRSEIDAGHTGDKTSQSDPATVPMTADAEAGGHPTPPEAIKKARDESVAREERRKREEE